MASSLGQLGFLVAQHYATKRISNMYLRGTVAKRARVTPSKPRTIRNELEVLKRRVAANTARRVYYREAKTIVGAGTPGYLRTDWSVTNDFIANPDFRKDINGDRWKNHYLKINYTGDTPDVAQMRLIVYSGKKAGAEFQPTADATGFCTPLDPSAFTVYYDSMIQNPNALNPYHLSRLVRLNVNSLYNGSSTPGVLERGDIRVQIQFQNSATLNGGTAFTQLCVSDH